MAIFDRYMLSQLLVLFGFFSLVLVMVYWVNRAVGLFEQLIGDGQSALVFLELSALTLPNVIRIVLPISAFIATVYATNRLSSESELVVMQTTGFSPFRLARPVVVFGLLVTLFMSVLTHFLVPMAGQTLVERQDAIAKNVSARFLSEGEFLNPTDGLTFYIRRIEPTGELLDIFLSDQRKEESQTIYTARRALLVREDDGAKLLMFDGLAQTIDPETQNLSITQFDDFAYDISGLVPDNAQVTLYPAILPTHVLLSPDVARILSPNSAPSDFMLEAHERFAQPMLALVTSLIGFACLLIGGFSRFGIWRQILFAIALLAVIKSIDNALTDLTRSDPTLWPVLYLPTIIGLSIAALILYLAGNPALWRSMRLSRRNA